MPEPTGFLSALKSAWGVGGDDPAPQTTAEASNLQGLVDQGERWLAGSTPKEAFARSLDALRPQVAAVRADIQADMDNAKNLSPAMREAARALDSAFESADQAITLASQALSRDDAGTVRQALQVLEGARQIVLARRSDVEQISLMPLCPRCGLPGGLGRGGTPSCRACGCHLVVPDPDPRPFRTVMLGPAYAAVFEACRTVSTGEQGLDALPAAVEPLVSQLSRLRGSVRKLLSSPADEIADLATEEFEGMEKDSGICIEGLQQILGFRQTLRCADLNRGWDKVSGAASCLQRHLRAVGPQGGSRIEMDDLIELSFDE